MFCENYLTYFCMDMGSFLGILVDLILRLNTFGLNINDSDGLNANDINTLSPFCVHSRGALTH